MRNKIILKSFLIWLGIIPLAFINGGIREFLLIPNFGRIGLPISAFILCALIFLLAYTFIPSLGKATKGTYKKIGILWAIATVVFEVLLGFMTGKSVYDIIAPYNIFTGNLWIMVVIFTGFVPIIIARKKKLFK